MVEKLSEAERALLTEEELEGLLEEDEGDEGDDEGAEGDEDAGAGDTDVGDGTDKTNAAAADASADTAVAAASAASSQDTADAAASAAATADTDGSADGNASSTDDGDDLQQRTPAWSLPAEVGERIKAIDAERDRLAVEFDDGALTAEDLREKQRVLEDERDQLRTRQISAQVNLDIAKSKWLEESVPGFLKDNPQYRNSPVLNKALDAEVRKLQASAVNPFDPKILQKAHATISGEITDAFKPKTPTPPPATNATVKQPAKTTKREAVPTLAHVPAADITDADDGGEFAYLDRLADTDSVAYEKELAKLSPEKQDRYLSQ